jgi:hypothetical protein
MMVFLKRLGQAWPTMAAALIVVCAMLILRLINSNNNIALEEIQLSALSFTLHSDARYVNLFNETAESDRVLLAGFAMQSWLPSGNRDQAQPREVPRSIMLQRVDQLHLKSLFVRPGTRVTLNIDRDVLGIVLQAPSEDSCCDGLIGVGTIVSVDVDDMPKPGVSGQVSVDAPNIKIACATSPCSMSFQLRSTAGSLIGSEIVEGIRLDKAGTEVHQGPPDSSILKGNLRIAATDLFGDQFSVRSIELSRGDRLTIDPKATARIAVDLRPDSLGLAGIVIGARTLAFEARAGDSRNVLPSILEIAVREPWPKTLVGAVLAAIPLIVGLSQICYSASGRSGRRRGRRARK